MVQKSNVPTNVNIKRNNLYKYVVMLKNYNNHIND